jgi:alpha-aminoadipic semialdehyde synthase
MAWIGIRREDKNRWERRVPLTPAQVGQLVEQGVGVFVQPSSLRIFGDEEYAQAGARLAEELSDAPVILGVKEMPEEIFEPNKTYVFFSHTHKGQSHNMPMLDRLLRRNCSLIDYELIRDAEDRRLIFFGQFAGMAGMIDTLWAYGRRLEAEGTDSPFSALRRAWEYESLDQAKSALTKVSKAISRHGLPAGMGPLVCGFSGYGRVSQGAQEIFDLLPVREIDPEQLIRRDTKDGMSRQVIYKTVFEEKHMYRRIEPAAFEFEEFVRHPERYRPAFERFIPHLDILVHGIYWEERFPRLITREALEQAWSSGERPRLRVVGDITCDIGGSIACTVKPTDSEQTAYIYDPVNDTALDGRFDGPGPLVMAVDNLPCELSREASEEFGAALGPYVKAIAEAQAPDGLDLGALPEEVRRGVVVHRGRLTDEHRHLERLLPRGTDE